MNENFDDLFVLSLSALNTKYVENKILNNVNNLDISDCCFLYVKIVVDKDFCDCELFSFVMS